MSDEFIFTVSRRRKYPALKINDAGKLEFLAPAGFTLESALKLIKANPEVVRRLRKRHAECSRCNRVWHDGMSVYWFGKLIPVYFTVRAHAVSEEALYVPGGEEPVLRAGLTKLYKTEAQKYLAGRTAVLAGRFGITYRSVTIGSAGSRWGSCSRDGRLRYSWKLLQCAPDLIDYVIIHELSHILEFNHSPKFWQEVCRMEPEYLEKRRELHKFSQKKELL